jgi:hypothetical protein
VCMLVVFLGFISVCCHLLLVFVGVCGKCFPRLCWCLWFVLFWAFDVCGCALLGSIGVHGCCFHGLC